MTTAEHDAVMAVCDHDKEANAQAALDDREIKGDGVSLQEAFLQFRKKKQVSANAWLMQGMIKEITKLLFFLQDELRERLATEQQAAKRRRDPLHMEILRRKFLDKALEYVGVPYAQRYHPPECMYLCC